MKFYFGIYFSYIIFATRKLKQRVTMAKKKQTIEEPAAIDIIADLKINVITSPNIDYSPCAFGTDFTNWKNYIESDIEKMKKNIFPRIGDLVQDREGNNYRFTDIRLSERKEKETTIPVYIFDLMISQ